MTLVCRFWSQLLAWLFPAKAIAGPPSKYLTDQNYRREVLAEVLRIQKSWSELSDRTSGSAEQVAALLQTELKKAVYPEVTMFLQHLSDLYGTEPRNGSAEAVEFKIAA